MLDHIGFNVSDFTASLRFYEAALKTTGLHRRGERRGVGNDRRQAGRVATVDRQTTVLPQRRSIWLGLPTAATRCRHFTTRR